MIDNLVSATPANGAKVVARAWVDPEFKRRLLTDATAATRELGMGGVIPFGLTAVENTDRLHHLIVGTLDSAGYPRQLLGPPPTWYKSLEYRARAVSEPRAVLREFGMDLPDDTEVRVLDGVAHDRYLVVPRRPKGTERLTEDELARLVTRDSMIGVGEARSPGGYAVAGPDGRA